MSFSEEDVRFLQTGFQIFFSALLRVEADSIIVRIILDL
jgi:hypothetical protein